MSKSSRKSAPGFSNFGFSTILLAFVMICIVTIAALSLITASSDYKLSQKVADKNSAYYAAEKEAFEYLSQIDEILASSYSKAIGANSYYKEVEKSLQNLSNGSYERASGTFSYTVPITENQDLEIQLRIHYPTNDSSAMYEIITWKSVYEEIEIDEGTLDLID